jgi:KipI family sensor histidine kinase inhibitor
MLPYINLISDNSIEILFTAEISKKTNKQIRIITKEIKSALGNELIDIIPAYHNILINFDCIRSNPTNIIKKIKSIISNSKIGEKYKKEIVEIPVCYEKPYSLDIDFVCNSHNISKNDLIKKHTNPEYLVYMIGFTPGFPYLGGMDSDIATPRKKKPRTFIPSGSVGIAGSQTGIYPIESPGGWQIIGRTPYNLFDPYREPAVMIEVGQYIKFRSISKKEYNHISSQMEAKNGKV